MSRIAIVFVLLSISLAQAEMLLQSVVTILSSESSQNVHGSWLSAAKGASVAQILQDDGKWIAELKNGKQVKIGFHRHMPISVEDLPLNGLLALRIRCDTQGVKQKIRLCWLDDNLRELAPTTIEFMTSTNWQELTVPLPPGAGTVFRGLIIKLDKSGTYEFADIQIVQKKAITVEPVGRDPLLKSDVLSLSGTAADGVEKVEASFGSQKLQTVNVAGNQYCIEIPKEQLCAYSTCSIILSAIGSRGPVDSVETKSFFVFPTLKNRQLDPVKSVGRDLYAGDSPFVALGLNYTDFNLGLSLHPNMDYVRIANAIKTMSDWGINCVRIPLTVALLQPAPGVFPDQPEWAEIFNEHGLKPEFFDYLEYFIQLAADHGIYSILDLHQFVADPYRTFAGGGGAKQKKAGEPGTAVSWRADSKYESRKFPEFDRPGDVQALCDTFHWLATHFKGNSNIMAIEVPYNEPHDSYVSIPSNYRRIVEQTTAVIRSADSNRLMFAMPAAWGHDNQTWASWILPCGITGLAPHFYLAASPVPLRPEAPQTKSPWLCRDQAAAFDHGMASVLLPFSSRIRPVYNGEYGAHAVDTFLPDIVRSDAGSYMVEGAMVQNYAAGLSGGILWTLWEHPSDFKPFADSYGSLFTRFSPVYRAGPVNWSHADVAFIQNPAAIPVQNGQNYSCVPFARLMLDLHLAPVHYLTDDQIIYTGLSSQSEGLEQVSATSFSSAYKALVVDRRNLDARVLQALENSAIPILWSDDADALTHGQVVAFLRGAGVAVNTKSPAEIQIVEGPKHLVLYRRSGDSTGSVRVFPSLKRGGTFSIHNEDGKTVFTGNADNLFEQGISVDIPKWRSAIFRVEQLE